MGISTVIQSSKSENLTAPWSPEYEKTAHIVRSDANETNFEVSVGGNGRFSVLPSWAEHYYFGHEPEFQALSRKKQDECKESIRDLLKTANKQNWDGDEADPVDPEAAQTALKLVSDFPMGTGLPEVSADPHGRVDFDWSLDNGAMFTLSVGKDGEIAVSGLYGEQSRLTGMAWDKNGERLCLVECGLEWLRKMKDR